MSNSPSIAQLQSDWFNFSDLDRASAVHAIKQSGTSIRKIAAQLQFSESLLRHLLQALQAPAADQYLARQGKISTNELARRARTLLHPAKQSETLTIDRDQESRIAADLISDWLLQTPLFRPAREMIVKEAQRKFLSMKEAGLYPSASAPPGTSVSQIIKCTEPPTVTDESVDVVAWFAQWLCRWSFFAFPNEDARDSSLSLALEKQQRS